MMKIYIVYMFQKQLKGIKYQTVNVVKMLYSKLGGLDFSYNVNFYYYEYKWGRCQSRDQKSCSVSILGKKDNYHI